jgi:hypothetical protein
MRYRKEAVKYAEKLMNEGSAAKNSIPNGPHHFGKLEVRALLDFIYEGPPISAAEEFNAGKWE